MWWPNYTFARLRHAVSAGVRDRLYELPFRNSMPRNFCPFVTLLAVITLTAGCTTSNQSEHSSPNAAQSSRSLNSDTPALITFVNRSDQSVNVYWLDFGGNRQLYKTLEAGGAYKQQTFLTHPWLVTDANAQPWNVYMPEPRPRTVYLQAPSAAVIAR